MRDGEFFGMNAVGAGRAECLLAPLHCTLHGGSARHPTADLVGQMSQIVFELGRFARDLNELACVVRGRGSCETDEAEGDNQPQRFRGSHIRGLEMKTYKRAKAVAVR